MSKPIKVNFRDDIMKITDDEFMNIFSWDTCLQLPKSIAINKDAYNRFKTLLPLLSKKYNFKSIYETIYPHHTPEERKNIIARNYEKFKKDCIVSHIDFPLFGNFILIKDSLYLINVGAKLNKLEILKKIKNTSDLKSFFPSVHHNNIYFPELKRFFFTTKIQVPEVIELEWNRSLVDFHYSTEVIYFVTKDGVFLYPTSTDLKPSYGINQETEIIPQELIKLDNAKDIDDSVIKLENIIKISNSREQTLFLSKNGEIFVCGYEFGSQNILSYIPKKMLLNDVNGKITKILSGNNYHIFITDLGNLYFWGLLTDDGKELISQPKIIDLDSEIKIIDILSKPGGFYAHSSDGKVFAFGNLVSETSKKSDYINLLPDKIIRKIGLIHGILIIIDDDLILSIYIKESNEIKEIKPLLGGSYKINYTN